ncbi:MAG: carboxypeptidase regulatory-like domain-containing protein [Planctomycetota bacterium]
MAVKKAGLTLAAVIGVLALGAWLRSGREDWVEEDLPAPTETQAMLAAEPLGVDAPTESLSPDAGQVVESSAHEIDVADGDGVIDGRVFGPWGEPCPGSRVTLWCVRLPPELAADRGVESWRLVAHAAGRARPTLADRYPHLLEPRAAVTADAEGRFRFRRLPPAEYLVAAVSTDTLVSPAPSAIPLGFEPEAPLQASVDVFLQEAYTFEARVVDANDFPVVNARVRLTGNVLESEDGVAQSFLALEQLFGYRLNPIELEAVTDVDGWVELAGLPPLEYQVLVSVDSWAPSETLHVVPSAAPAEIVLEAGGGLAGRVVDDQGDAVAGAAVQLIDEYSRAEGSSFLESARESRTTIADTTGSFRFAAVPTGVYRLVVTHAGHRPGSAKGLRVAADAESEVWVTLEVGAVLGGVVLSPTGEPVADADVTVATDLRRPWRVDLRAKTGGDGRFRFDTLTGQRVRLEFRHDDWAPHSEEVAPGEEDLAVVLGEGREVVGQIVDEGGESIDGASVWLNRRGERTRHAKTDAAGRFRFAGLGPEPYELSARATGYLEYREALDAAVEDLGQVALGAAPLIVGKVLGPDQRGLAGARVSAREVDVKRPASVSAVTRHDGAFELSLSKADATWKVSAEYPMMLALDQPERRVTTRAAPVVDVCMGWGAGLRGVVVDRAGVAIPRARISLQPERRPSAQRGSSQPSGGVSPGRTPRAGSVRSRADGRFQITGLEPGTYRLEATADGFAPERVPGLVLLPERVDQRDLVLEDERVLYGVVREVSGPAIAGARVRVLGEAVGGARETTSSADGYYEIGGLGDGEIQVRVSSPGYSSWVSPRRRVEAGSFDVDLEPCHEVFGWVLDVATGEPWPDVSVRLRGYDAAKDLPKGGRDQRAQTDAEGRFSFGEVAAGEYWLSIGGAGALPLEPGRLRVPRDVPLRGLEYRAERGAVLSGQVATPGGAGLEKATIRIFRLTEKDGKLRADHVQQVHSDASGGFEVAGLADGDYRVVIEHARFVAEVVEPVSLSADRVDPFLRRTLEPGAVVRGRVVLRPGVAAGDVIAERANPRFRRSTKADANGLFELAGLPPGDYTVWHQSRRGRERSEVRAITLRAGQHLEVIVTSAP